MKLRFFLLVVIVGAVALAAFLYTRSKTGKPSQITPAPTPYALGTITPWRGVEPGVSTKEEVIIKLGNPLSSEETNGGVVYYYPTTNQYWKNEVVAMGETVVFIRERIFSPSITSLKTLTARFSEESVRLFGPDWEGGTFLIAYPKRGAAYLANTSRDVVYQVWRFPPTTLEGFLMLPQAAGYGTTPEEEPEAY